MTYAFTNPSAADLVEAVEGGISDGKIPRRRVISTVWARRGCSQGSASGLGRPEDFAASTSGESAEGALECDAVVRDADVGGRANGKNRGTLRAVARSRGEP
jgi:hypothetical protein